MIIDFHTHTFPDKIAAKTLAALGKAAAITPFTSGTEAGLITSMADAGIDYSVTFPVMTSPGQVEKINSGIIQNLEVSRNNGLIYLGGIHPDFDDYKRELHRLHDAHIPGIKLHPAYQATNLDDIRMMRIIDCASELNMVVLVHAGIDIGIPGHNFASTAHVLHVLKEVHPEKLVLAHMGGWGCWNDVEQYLAGAPLYFDTSFSLTLENFHPDWKKNPQYKDNMSADQFLRLCQKHGTDKILFATDSPWQSQSEYVAAMQEIPFTKPEKEAIFAQNAKKLLNITL